MQEKRAFQIHQINDHTHRVVAAVMRHPDGWQAESHVAWNFQHSSAPVKIFAHAMDPQSGCMFEALPVEQYCWLEPNMGFRQPFSDLNDGTFLIPPMNTGEALARCVLPRYRAIPGLQMKWIGPAPNVVRDFHLSSLQSAQTEGVVAQISYEWQGRRFDEEILGLKYMFPGIPSYGAGGVITQYNWGFGRLFCFRAPEGQLDTYRELFWAMAKAIEPNPLWEQLCARIIQQLHQQFQQHLQAGYANIAAASRLSQMISAQNDQWLQQQEQRRQDDWQREQQQRHDAAASPSHYTANDAFGDMMMGRETYEDSYWASGTSQHDYWQYVYTDDMGHYKYSDTPIDPNIGENATFHQMRKKQIGE